MFSVSTYEVLLCRLSTALVRLCRVHATTVPLHLPPAESAMVERSDFTSWSRYWNVFRPSESLTVALPRSTGLDKSSEFLGTWNDEAWLWGTGVELR